MDSAGWRSCCCCCCGWSCCCTARATMRGTTGLAAGPALARAVQASLLRSMRADMVGGPQEESTHATATYPVSAPLEPILQEPIQARTNLLQAPGACCCCVCGQASQPRSRSLCACMRMRARARPRPHTLCCCVRRPSTTTYYLPQSALQRAAMGTGAASTSGRQPQGAVWVDVIAGRHASTDMQLLLGTRELLWRKEYGWTWDAWTDSAAQYATGAGANGR